MADVTWLWILGGTVMTFLLGGAYYAVFGRKVAELSDVDATVVL